MPSVAYARIINCEGIGEGIAVGSGVCVTVVLGVGVAEAEQDVNKMASNPRLEKKRGILSKGKVEAIGELSHCLSQKRIQICIFVFEHLFCDHCQFLTELVFDPSPERNGAIGT